MTEMEKTAMLIDTYINLQRIKLADDRDEEIDYQIKAVKKKLEVFGIAAEVVETLTL